MVIKSVVGFGYTLKEGLTAISSHDKEAQLPLPQMQSANCG